MPISVGSVEVDVIPNTRGIYQRLFQGIVPAATRVGDDVGRVMGQRITSHVRGAIRDGITQGGAGARASAARQGDETGGAFSRALKIRLEAAFRSLPKLQVGANTSEADADLQALRVRMESLADKRVGIDISAEDAKAEIRLIEAELTRLGSRHPNVQVRADTASALAQLRAVREEIDGVDRKRARVKVDTSGATRALFQLSVAAAGIVAIPALPVIAAGLGAVTSAAVAATVGLGALAAAAVPAIIDIVGALQAQKAAQDAAATATAKGAQAAAQGQQRALQMAGAQQALAAAHRNAASSIRGAERAVADAVEQAAEANARAVEQVRQARQAVADAVQQAADRQLAAGQRVEQAERSLRDAQVSARQAQQDLTQARRDAAMELEDLQNRLVGAQLGERDATLAVKKARLRLDAVRAAGDRASLLTQQEAQLAYDEAVQRLKEQQLSVRRLADEKKAADRAGVEGSDTVKQAQDRLAQAQQSVRDQQAGLAQAQQEQTRAQVEGIRQVAEAQDKLAQAQSSVAKAQQDGAEAVRRAQESLAEARVSAAEQIASAERQVESAQLSQAGAADQAAVAQEKYQQALAKLTPSARGTFDSFIDLRDAFKGWSRELQPKVMPLFTRALNGLRKSLPGLTPFVTEAAEAVGDLQDRASKGFKSPWWKSFKKDLQGSIKPAIVGLGVAFGNVFKTIGGIVDAFLPHMDSISERMQKVTGRWARWATNLKGSPEFERFLSYAAEQAPVLGQFLGDLGSAFYQVSKSLAPLSGPVMEVLGAVARAIASIAETLPWLIQGMYLAYVATRIWTLGMILFNAVMNANPITLIVLAVVALVAAVIYAYKHWGWFRKAVQAAWDGIRTAAEFAWERVLKPAFAAIRQAMQFVGRIAMWLWKNAIKPAFDGIVLVGKVLAAILITLVLAPIVIAFQAVGAIATWLWENAISPAFQNIGKAATWLWEKAVKPAFDAIGEAANWLWLHIIKPAFDGIKLVFEWWYNNVVKRYFDLVKTAIHLAGDAFKWLRDKSVKPVFNGIRETISTVYQTGLKPVFSKIKTAVGLVGDAFESAKNAIRTAWGKIRDITKGPVNFIIKWVYDRGIKPIWDNVAGIVGLDPLPPAPKLLASGGTVGPGWGDAAPMRVNRPTAIVGEGNPRYPEYVIPTDPRYRGRARSLWQSAGTQLLEDGGILGGVWDWTKDVAKGGVDWLKTGYDLMSHPGKVWDGLTKPIRKKIGEIGDSRWAKMIGKLPIKLLGGLKSKLVSTVTSLFGSGGVAGGNWIKPVNARYGTKFGVAGPMWASGHHTGLDFPAPTGTPVKAVADGTVIQATSGGPYGKHIQIAHGGGLSSLYAHLSRMLVRDSQRVHGGDRIGLVGATGNVTGPHLHLEARLSGRAVDPMPYLTNKGFGAKASGSAQQVAKAMLSRYGWGPDQFGPLKKLWISESNWRWDARNPSSGAYGIPQALPPDKMRSTGADWRTNPVTQIKWGLGYIQDRYGSPAAAWNHWLHQTPHWYDSGGYLPEGLSLAYNGTGRPEAVITASQERALLSMAASRSTQAAGGGEFTGTLTLDNGAFVGQVRGVLHQEMQPVLSAIRTK